MKGRTLRILLALVLALLTMAPAPRASTIPTEDTFAKMPSSDPTTGLEAVETDDGPTPQGKITASESEPAIGNVIGHFTPPGGGWPVGLEHDGKGRLYLTELISDTVFLIDTSGAKISEFSYLPATRQGIGITTDGTYIYLTDADDDEVNVYTLEGTFVSSFTVSGQSAFPEGITYNPATGHLYMVDGDTVHDFNGGDHIFEYTLSGTLVYTYPLASTSTDGIAYDPQRCSYWVYDSNSDTVTHYDLNFNVMEAFSGTIKAGFSAGEGVAVITDILYVSAVYSNTIVAFDIAGAASACKRIYLPLVLRG